MNVHLITSYETININTIQHILGNVFNVTSLFHYKHITSRRNEKYRDPIKVRWKVKKT